MAKSGKSFGAVMVLGIKVLVIKNSEYTFIINLGDRSITLPLYKNDRLQWSKANFSLYCPDNYGTFLL